MSADSSGTRATRATDTDRTAVITALDSALASGQLDQFEHYERVRVATHARRVSELRPLLADLQGVDVRFHGDRGPGRRRPASSSSSPSSTDPSSGTRPRITTRHPWGFLALFALVGVAIFASLLVVSQRLDDQWTGSLAGDTGAAVDRGAGDARVLDNPGPLTLAGLQRVFSTAAGASGSEVATRIIAHPQHASMTWTDPEHPSRELAKSYRGGWSETTDGPSSGDPSFRLADLDAEMIAPIIAGAPETLGVPDGRPTHVIIDADDAGMPLYSVYASNEFHQSGYLTVNHLGEPVRMFPAN